MYVISVEFIDLDLLPADLPPNLKRQIAADKSLCQRLGAPVARRTSSSYSKAHGFPFLSAQCDRPGLSISRKDLRLVEAGMFAAVRFVQLLATRPSPPPPHFSPVTFLATDVILEATRRRTRGKKTKTRRRKKSGQEGKTIKMRCVFPSGNLESQHYKYGSNPGLVMKFAPRPGNPKSQPRTLTHC